MPRRSLHRWTLWLLPILAARALLPLGFMLSVDASGLQLAFCPTQAPGLAQAFGPPAEAHAAHAHHHHHHGADAASSDASEGASNAFEAPCPYALAAVALTASAPPVEDAAPLASPLFSFEKQPYASSGPLRAERIRGPPRYS